MDYTINYDVLLCTTMYYYVLYYVLLCTTMYYYLLLCTMYRRYLRKGFLLSSVETKQIRGKVHQQINEGNPCNFYSIPPFILAASLPLPQSSIHPHSLLTLHNKENKSSRNQQRKKSRSDSNFLQLLYREVKRILLCQWFPRAILFKGTRG